MLAIRTLHSSTPDGLGTEERGGRLKVKVEEATRINSDHLASHGREYRSQQMLANMQGN